MDPKNLKTIPGTPKKKFMRCDTMLIAILVSLTFPLVHKKLLNIINHIATTQQPSDDRILGHLSFNKLKYPYQQLFNYVHMYFSADCRLSLGMQAGKIPDSAVTSSSSYDESVSAPNAR